ncbi:MAG: hypothetical protein LBD20_03725 [Spirochaetaceae bacterium]|jgi:hypothetical protein|nr:hypothetical protein [Spirochaetaceae bacterium]
MAEKPVYAHGELDAVKKRLGPISDAEARKMQAILGGEVGKERSGEDAKKPIKKRPGGASKKPARIVETVESDAGAGGGGDSSKAMKRTVEKPNFSERIKMDVLCGESEYGIKSWLQVLRSKLSFFHTPPDTVSSYFIKRILNDYCSHLEALVTETRFLFPRNNAALTERLKSASLFSFHVLDAIRRWNIEAIMSEKNKMQRRSLNVYASDFTIFIYELYKPMYILEYLEVNPHIETVYNTLYRVLFMENATKETEKKKDAISKTISAYQFVSGGMRRRFYPLFMKLISSSFFEYDDFFIECAGGIEAFLGVSKKDRILPPKDLPGSIEIPPEELNIDEALDSELEADGSGAEQDGSGGDESADEGSRLSDTEQKAFDKGLVVLDQLFPKADWLKLDSFPDMYPYFSDVKSLVKGAELLAPEDPCSHVLILSSIIEELLYGFRKIQFSDTSEGSFQIADDDDNTPLDTILDNWQKIIEESFERQYIPRIQECAQLFQHAGHKKNNPYGLKLRSGIHWTRRFFFFPYYNYKDNTPPPFKKSEITALYPFVRHFRKKLTVLATAIDRAQKMGGRDADAAVDGLKNPWSPYVFQIENPLSRRLNTLLAKKQRDNVSLIFFTLAIVTVLDNLMNDENSIAYTADMDKLYRTAEDGETPVLWVGKTSDTFSLFKTAALERAKK